jgi:hypothetical protein
MSKIAKCLNVAIIAAVFSMMSTPAALAVDFVTLSHTTTIAVPETISITSDVGNFTLTMPSNASGAVSNTQAVVYTVKANKMRQADGAPGINANLDFAYDRINFQAQVGLYTKVGGNTELVAAPVVGGWHTIGTSNVAIANKTASVAPGDILDGTIPVTYRAVATANMPSGNQVHILFVTLTTI